jgi:hypothetical protein
MSRHEMLSIKRCRLRVQYLAQDSRPPEQSSP